VTPCRLPLHCATIGFAAGTTAVQFGGALLDFHWLAFAGAGLLLGSCRLRVSACRGVLVFCALLSIGAALASWRGAIRMTDELPAQFEGVDIELTGVVAALPAVVVGATRFVFDVEHVFPMEAVVPRHVAMSWFEPRDGGRDLHVDARVHVGERWRLHVRLKRPHGTLNFAGFDSEAWLFERNLRAVGYVRDDAGNQRVESFVATPLAIVERHRERLRARILAALQGKPYAGVIVALTIGDQQAVPEPQWRIFNRTGISHLISISGLHITVFASVVGAVVLLFVRYATSLTSRLPARKVAVIAGALAAAGYTFLAGAEVPAQRTLIMLAIAAAGVLLARPVAASLVWTWALVVVLLVDPWASVAPGFWLSFSAVGLLLYAGTKRMEPRPPRRLYDRLGANMREGAEAQWVVTLGLVPLTIALFQQASLVAPLANAVAIPVVTFGVVSLALVGIIVPFDFTFVGAHAVFAQLMRYLDWLASLPDGAWQQHAPPAWTVVAAVLGILWILAPRGIPGRMLGSFWLLPMFVITPELPAQGAFRIAVFDVGQGLSTLVQTRSHNMLFDTGPRYGEIADAGSRIVAPNLRAMGAQALDLMIISHADSDHSGGALSVLDVVPVRRLTSSLNSDHPIVQRMGPAASTRCIAGQTWLWEDVRFEILWPRASDYDDPHVKTNDLSCVVRIVGSGGSALLTGDMEARDEQALLQAGVDVRADVIVVPHHGSRTSSTREFVDKVGASVAIFTPGYRNRFGHPRPEVVARYRDSGAALVRSDADGAVELDVGGASPLTWRTARVDRRRYWNDVMEISER
jgi:competence protein ComEC